MIPIVGQIRVHNFSSLFLRVRFNLFVTQKRLVIFIQCPRIFPTHLTRVPCSFTRVTLRFCPIATLRDIVPLRVRLPRLVLLPLQHHPDRHQLRHLVSRNTRTVTSTPLGVIQLSTWCSRMLERNFNHFALSCFDYV